ncbi:MAG: hypothetical protein GY715_03040 [Planctomycetes bacterium]|nr:hypothetical protein [Planctomycetota bacterium]
MELIVALALTSILMVGMGGALMVGTRSMDTAEDLLVQTRAGGAVSQITADARLATSIVDHTDTSITLLVPDRDSPPDGSEERIRYTWEGAAGKPAALVRQYNDGAEGILLNEVHDFVVAADARSATVRAATVTYTAPVPDPATWGYFGPTVGEPPWLATGTYDGDGSDDRLITGVGFVPDVVIIKGNVTGETAVIRTSTVVGDATKSMTNGLSVQPNQIQTLDVDGFTVGTHATVNANGSSYWWTAFRQTTDLVKVGRYAGDGADNRNISDVGFQPDYVIVYGENGLKAWQRTSAMTGDQSIVFGEEGAVTNQIQAIEPTGFQVGHSDHVNGAGILYHYACFKATPEKIAVGSYPGDNASDRQVTGIGVRPEYVLIKIDEYEGGVHRPASVGTGDVTLNFNTGVQTANAITALLNDGFEVGLHKQTNRSGVVYHWAAFGGAPGPVVEGSEVVFEGWTDAKEPSNVQTITVDTPPGTADGDLLIAAVVTDGDESVEPPLDEGWTAISHGSEGGKVTLGVWWKLADASEAATHRFTWGSDEQAYAWIMRFTGHDPLDPIPAITENGESSSTPTALSVDTSVNNALVLRIGGFDDDDIDPGVTGLAGLAGHTDITMDESSSLDRPCSGGAAFIVQPAAGTCPNASFALTNNEQARTVSIVINPQP